MKHSLLICLGSNVANSAERIKGALLRFNSHLRIERVSDVLVSEDASGRGAAYTNVLLECGTNLSQKGVEDMLSAIELAEGRMPQSKELGLVELDADIVVWDEGIIRPDDHAKEYFQKLLSTLK